VSSKNIVEKSGEPRRWRSWGVRRGIGLGGNYRNSRT